MKIFNRFYRDNSGITGLETAIILIAFVVVAAVFAFTVMTTGLFSTEKAKTTAQAALTEASSSFITKGAVTATCAAAGGGAPPPCAYVNSITFTVALASGADAQTLSQAELSFLYSDPNNTQRTSGLVPVGGIITQETAAPEPDGNGTDIVSIIDTGPGGTGSLEAGESAAITVNLAATGGGVTQLGAGTKFRIEMMAPKGGTLIVERDIPKVLTGNMNLN
jgi:flagellin FlaB